MIDSEDDCRRAMQAVVAAANRQGMPFGAVTSLLFELWKPLHEVYAPTPERALMMAQAMEREAEAAIRYHNRPRGGQQVSFHGDFASAAISACIKIKWWTREIRRCLGDDRKELPEE